MSTAYLFPGQGSQAPGMAKPLFDASDRARQRFAEAREILGFDIAEVMFNGTADDLRRTSVTQPAIFLHSVILAELLDIRQTASMVAGHSLGEFSALTAIGVLPFAQALDLVRIRANAMQAACDLEPSTMAAIVGLDAGMVEIIASEVPNVVAANYNEPSQLVLSGSKEGIAQAVELAKQRGAKIAKEIPVNGAFHSPYMQPAAQELARGIHAAQFQAPSCPVYQNVDGLAYTDPEHIRQNLIAQLTSAVRWTQTIENMRLAGASRFVELGPGKVLSGLVKRIDKDAVAENRDTL